MQKCADPWLCTGANLQDWVHAVFEMTEGANRVEQFFHVGTITSPHGVRGDVKVFPTTDDPERFLDLDKVILRKNGREAGQEIREISNVRFIKNMVILHLEGVPDRNAAELYRQWELYVPREDAVPLSEDEYYIADLVGMKVYREEGFLGTLREVMQTGANDVYVVDSPEWGEVLIPAIKACIMKVDPAEGRMDVHLLPGLIDERKEKK